MRTSSGAYFAVGEEGQMMRLGAIERRNGGDDRAAVSDQRAVDQPRNGLGGEGPLTPTAVALQPDSGRLPRITAVAASSDASRPTGARRRRGSASARGAARLLAKLRDHAVRHVEVLVHRHDRRPLIRR